MPSASGRRASHFRVDGMSARAPRGRLACCRIATPRCGTLRPTMSAPINAPGESKFESHSDHRAPPAGNPEDRCLALRRCTIRVRFRWTSCVRVVDLVGRVWLDEEGIETAQGFASGWSRAASPSRCAAASAAARPGPCLQGSGRSSAGCGAQAEAWAASGCASSAGAGAARSAAARDLAPARRNAAASRCHCVSGPQRRDRCVAQA
jgi:hypothetical protein